MLGNCVLVHELSSSSNHFQWTPLLQNDAQPITSAPPPCVHHNERQLCVSGQGEANLQAPGGTSLCTESTPLRMHRNSPFQQPIIIM